MFLPLSAKALSLKYNKFSELGVLSALRAFNINPRLAGFGPACRFFCSQRNYSACIFLLLLFEVATNCVQVVAELGRVFLTNFSDFFNNRIFPHFINPPSILRACKSPAARNPADDKLALPTFVSPHWLYVCSSK